MQAQAQAGFQPQAGDGGGSSMRMLPPDPVDNSFAETQQHTSDELRSRPQIPVQRTPVRDIYTRSTGNPSCLSSWASNELIKDVSVRPLDSSFSTLTQSPPQQLTSSS